MAKEAKKNTKKVNVKKEVKKVNIENEVKKEKTVAPKKVNKRNIKLWWLLGLVLPPVGLVLYILWRKNRKDDAKSIGTASLIAAIVWLFFGMSFLVHTKGVNAVANWKADFDNGDTIVTVIASSTCPHCQNLKPIIEASSEKHGYKLYFFEADKLSDEEYKTISTAVTLEGYEGYVPYTFVISDKKFIKSNTGEMTDDALTEFLKSAKVIKN